MLEMISKFATPPPFFWIVNNFIIGLIVGFFLFKSHYAIKNLQQYSEMFAIRIKENDFKFSHSIQELEKNLFKLQFQLDELSAKPSTAPQIPLAIESNKEN